jgi:mono/diheme cytochrome c family protein
MKLRFFTATLLFLASALYSQQPLSYGTCAACHGPDGKGFSPPGLPSPMAPALAASKLANAGDGEIITAIVLNGIVKEDAKYMGMMSPLGPMLTDEQLAEVITYVRSNFGNKAPAVTVDQVKQWRAKYNGKPMWKRADLEKMLPAE